jgi:hypothetical protein
MPGNLIASRIYAHKFLHDSIIHWDGFKPVADFTKWIVRESKN